jgi:hypothetical protein
MARKIVPLNERTIPGITWKQVVAFVIVIVTGVGVYFSVREMAKKAYEQSVENGRVLNEIQSDRKESERLNNIRLTNIELDQREAKIRLTNLETDLNKK